MRKKIANCELRIANWYYVGLGFLVMLLITGGRPSGFIVGLCVLLGIGFVVWDENKRSMK
ncbi:hypothetical protein [Nostoc sp. FACHB-145]|uniref:hypothetical protein n=1 Tax=Nostoc sp. FACHB-145 TaxID=2692836 RepID=UPI0016882882|nr:hypothetical protein [Nostoc sp. FACHB-145]MBD2472279.1 hypothetical protein [Nostoc sp. FACHB-145]